MLVIQGKEVVNLKCGCGEVKFKYLVNLDAIISPNTCCSYQFSFKCTRL